MLLHHFIVQVGAAVSLWAEVLCTTAYPSYACQRPQRRGQRRKGYGMNDKLEVLVRVDLECVSAHIEVIGLVDAKNIQALFILAKRASSIIPGLEVVLDLSGSRVTTEALAQLTLSAASCHIPASIDSMQTDCRLVIVPPLEVAYPAAASQAA